MALLRTGLAASLCLSALVLAGLGTAVAQAPAPRDVPDGFVLPGPAPTNAPAAPGGVPADVAPAMSAPAAPGPLVPPTPPSVSGSMVTAPSALTPTVGTTRLSGTTSGGAVKPSWPCVQRKLDHVTAGQVWPGPPLDAAASVERTGAMRQLVAAVAARRLPLPEAEKTAVDFVKALPETGRTEAATAVFADLLRTLDAERAEIMRGIERYGARQQQLAAKLRAQNADLSDIRSSGDAAKAMEAQEALLWDTRVFDERRRSLTYVCEVPVLIEQRLFALGRAINGAL